MLAIRAVPLIVCLPIGGVISDRTSRRAVLVGADLAVDALRFAADAAARAG